MNFDFSYYFSWFLRFITFSLLIDLWVIRSKHFVWSKIRRICLQCMYDVCTIKWTHNLSSLLGLIDETLKIRVSFSSNIGIPIGMFNCTYLNVQLRPPVFNGTSFFLLPTTAKDRDHFVPLCNTSNQIVTHNGIKVFLKSCRNFFAPVISRELKKINSWNCARVKIQMWLQKRSWACLGTFPRCMLFFFILNMYH